MAERVIGREEVLSRLMTRLAVFDSGFDEDCAAAVLADTDISSLDVLDLLARPP